MDINSALASFAQKMTQICIYKNDVKYQVSKELTGLYEQRMRAAESGASVDAPRSASNMLFQSALTGDSLSFGGRLANLDQSIEAAHLHRNKLYQWLIAEASEALDRFLLECYAAVGTADFAFWPLSDYGNKLISEVKELSAEERVALVQSKQNRTTHILNQFRRYLSDFERHETDNSLKINLRLFVCMTQKLRHAIVHNGGHIQDVDKFVEDTVNAAVIVKNKEKEKADSHIRSFFSYFEGRATINLLEVKVNGHPLNNFSILGVHHDICDGLLKTFVTYAHLLCFCVNQHFEHDNS